MKKRILFVLLVLALILSFGLSACSSEPAATTAPPAATTAPPVATITPPKTTTAPPVTTVAPPPATTAAGVKPIEIIFAHTTATVAGNSQEALKMGNAMEKASGGKLKFVWYWSNSLMPQTELVNGVGAGIATMCYLPLPVDYMPFSYGLMALPFMGFKSMKQQTEIFWQLYNKYPEMQKEFSSVKLLAARAMPGVQVNMAKKANVRLPAALKGTKLATSGEVGKVMSNMGAAAVSVTVQDLFMSLNSGLVDGLINHFPVVKVFGVIPVINYHTVFNNNEAGFALWPDTIIMNIAAFDKLSPDLQKIVIDEAKVYQEAMLKMDIAEIESAVNISKGMGHTFYNLTQDEFDQWAVYAGPNHTAWIKDMASKKFPAQAAYDDAKKLIGTVAQ